MPEVKSVAIPFGREWEIQRLKSALSHLILQVPLTEAQKAFNRRWIEALRSGTYQQGQCLLRAFGAAQDGSEDLYCCVGVACDLYDPTAWEKDLVVRAWEYHGLGATVSNAGHEEFLELTGFSRLSLAQANDAGVTFEEIADALEELL